LPWRQEPGVRNDLDQEAGRASGRCMRFYCGWNPLVRMMRAHAWE
jgi:hypothetical protein